MRIIIIGIMPFHDYDYTKSYSGQSNSLIVMISNSGASGWVEISPVMALYRLQTSLGGSSQWLVL